MFRKSEGGVASPESRLVFNAFTDASAIITSPHRRCEGTADAAPTAEPNVLVPHDRGSTDSAPRRACRWCPRGRSREWPAQQLPDRAESETRDPADRQAAATA